MTNLKNSYKTLSNTVKLILTREEGIDSEWKSSVGGVLPEDLVAFANSPNGGYILIGVSEVIDDNGAQKHKIVGCKVGDKQRLKILHKAQNCIPSINIEITAENTSRIPFYRVKIPSGNHKPYCTQQGVYKIREDGNKHGLKPDKLLSIFLEAESEVFLKRFKESAEELEREINNVSTDIYNAQSYLEDILPNVEELPEINALSDSISTQVENTKGWVEDVFDKAEWNEKRLKLLLNHFKIEDPWLTKRKDSFKHFLIRRLEDGEDITTKKFWNKIKDIYLNIDESQLKIWLDEFINENNLIK